MMQYDAWKERSFDSIEDWNEFYVEAMADLENQLGAKDLKIYKTLPYDYTISVVLATADDRKFMHLTMPDVREDAAWFDGIRLRRMSSERDWKGDEFHYCSWGAIGENAEKYFGDEYDEEAF